jgi:Tfp pilus assembly protein PilF
MIRARLEPAIALHRQGKLAQAKAIYQDILRKDPRKVDALHLLGIIAGQSGNFPFAAELRSRSLRQPWRRAYAAAPVTSGQSCCHWHFTEAP